MAKRIKKTKPGRGLIAPTPDNPTPNANGKGGKTDENVRLEFRERYLITGNARGSARFVGVPEKTGIQWAHELCRDPEFARTRSELRAYAVPALEAMMLHGAETLAEAIEGTPFISEQGLVSDNRAMHLRAIADVHGKLTARTKIDHDIAPENKQTGPIEVIFKIDGETDGPECGSGSNPQASG